MALSSNAIIHNTKTLNSLKKILTEGFRPFYCTETIHSSEYDPMPFKAPMICFSDIPLSEIKEQLDKYGAYGLGLTKAWASNNKLNPVLYLEENSLLLENYINSLFKFAGNADEVIDTSALNKEQKMLLDTIRYIKNYEAPLIRNGKTINKSYRFSDEREWRYVPCYTSVETMIETCDHYLTHKEKIDKELEKIRLKITPNDIRYIILKTEREIDKFIPFIEHTFKQNSLEDVKKLTTRIITNEQIKNDF